MFCLYQVTKWYGIDIDLHRSILISTLPILISSLIKNLKFIAWLSAIANVSMVGGLIIILYYCSIDIPSISTRVAIGHWTTIPLFFGTSIFSFEGISLVSFIYYKIYLKKCLFSTRFLTQVLPLQQEMKNPKQFSTMFGALNVGMGIVTGLIILTGFMGYLKFGDAVRGSLTLNLPEDFL